MAKLFCVYILTNERNTVLHIGVTSDLKKRVHQHKSDLVEGFTKRYRTHKLVYYQVAETAYSAIAREKQIKGGSRADKLRLIRAINPQWRDLYDEI